MKTENDTLNPYLSGIKEIEFADAKAIEIVHHEKLANGVPVTLLGSFEEICIEGLASLEVKRVKELGVYIYCGAQVQSIY